MEQFDKFYDRSNTNAEKYTLRKKLYGTDDVLPMWVADMDIETPTFILDEISKRLVHPILGYEEFPTSAKLAQINWMKNNHNFDINEDEILYSHSVVTSINLAIKAFTNIGDEVIVQPPVYFPFYSSITNNNRKVLRNPLKVDKDGDYCFDFKDLKSKITPKTKLLLLCSPHNPVGRVWKKKELKELSKICLDNNIKVFSDEIHSDLVFEGFKHIPFASLNKETKNITITAAGVGKTFNLAGVSTSTIIIQNKDMFKTFKKSYDSLHLAQGNIFGHIAFETAYNQGQKWRDSLISHLETNINKLEKMLLKHKDKITFKKPQGTYLVWIDCTKMGLNDKKLRKFFVEKAKLGLSAGTSFGKEGSKFMRINIAVPTKTMVKAIKNLHKALNTL
ncbi:MAG: PatB family C-S lyase [Campylobacterota bacterium]|nr:PatB family C-S lyase [Campylobacterota bacterium]